MSQDSIFDSREETWNGKIRTEAENLQVRRERKAGFQGVHPLAVVPLVVLDFGAGMCHPVGIIIEDLVFVPSIAVFETKEFGVRISVLGSDLIRETEVSQLKMHHESERHGSDRMTHRYDILSSTVRLLGDCVELLSLKLMNVPKLTI